MAKLKTKEIREIISDALASDMTREELIDTLIYIKVKTGEAEWSLRPGATCSIITKGGNKFDFAQINERTQIKIKDRTIVFKTCLYGGYKGHDLIGSVQVTVTRDGEVSNLLFFTADKRGDWRTERYADSVFEVVNKQDVYNFIDNNLVSEEGDPGMYWWD